MDQKGSSRASSHALIERIGLTDVTLVGQDVGGMIAYSYLRSYDDVARVLIMDVVIPGVDPWDDVLRNQYLWHFAMHAVPALPELLTKGRQGPYFDYFYDAISAKPAMIAPEARAAYVDAYSSDSALTAGFNWYLAFGRDGDDNHALASRRVATPLPTSAASARVATSAITSKDCVTPAFQASSTPSFRGPVTSLKKRHPSRRGSSSRGSSAPDRAHSKRIAPQLLRRWESASTRRPSPIASSHESLLSPIPWGVGQTLPSLCIPGVRP